MSPSPVMSATKTRSTRGTQDTPAYVALWKSIRALRQDLERLEIALRNTSTRFDRDIRPLEVEFTTAVHTLTAELIHRFQHHRFSEAQRSLLGLWISSNLQSLQAHPFAEQAGVDALVDQWRSCLQLSSAMVDRQLAAVNARDFPEARNHQFDTETTRTTQHSPFGHDDVDDAVDPAREHADTADRSRSENGTTSLLPNDVLDELENVLSVDRLFRKLAGALHPDKEPDESLKAQRHELMSQCLQAREARDIAALLSLYEEYVGDLPEVFGQLDERRLLPLLRAQLRALQLQRRFTLEADPLRKQIFERFHSTGIIERDRRFSAHTRRLHAEISQLHALLESLNETDGMARALEHREHLELDRLAIAEMTGMGA